MKEFDQNEKIATRADLFWGTDEAFQGNSQKCTGDFEVQSFGIEDNQELSHNNLNIQTITFYALFIW